MINEKDTQKEKNKKTETKACNIHVMPPLISDEDISSLFKGLIGIVRRKVELETRAEIINMNISIEKLMKELKEKQAECNRLKNELLYLKAKH